MKAIVTGGAGFIGSHLAEHLLEEGHEVTVIDNFISGRKQNLEKCLPSSSFQLVEKDILQKEKILPYFEGVDWVFHLAALADIVPSIENPELYYQTNVTGTFNILECAKKGGAKRFIYAASSSCYGIPDEYPTKESAPLSPMYPYALTKYLGEELVMHWETVYKLPSLSLRLFNVFGPRARTSGSYGAVFGVFLAQKLKQKPFTIVGDGTQTRDFIYVKDVARAFYLAALSSLSGEAFNIGSSKPYSINYIADLLGGEKTYIPKRPGEPDCTFADMTKSEKNLCFTAKIPFEKGVQNLLHHIDDFHEAPLWEEASIKEATKTWFKYLK